MQPSQDVDCLELDHLIGFSGKNLHSIYFHSVNSQYIIYPVGGLVVIENSSDKHDQIFLRGHDMPVSAITVSPSGNFIASGQVGSIYTQTKEAPIILWDFNKRKAINVFRGIQQGVLKVSFSHDEKFLAAIGQNNTLTIWNCQDFSLVHNKILELPIGLIAWSVPRKSATQYSTYILITSVGSNIVINSLDFNVSSMQYSLKSTNCQLPSSGLIRSYSQAIVDVYGNYIYVGTSAGEVCIYHITNEIFKAALPVSNNGVLAIAMFQDTLLVGSGDGKIKQLRGTETKWSLECETQLEGAITSLSLSADFKEVLVGTSNNNIYRVLVANLNSMIHAEGHMSSILGISFEKQKSDYFATIDTLGYVILWDNNEFNIITKCTPGTMVKASGTCVTMGDDASIVAGYNDGFIRCYTITNQRFSPLKWEIANAHQGAITSLYSDDNYNLSGGQDGIVRVWSKSNRQLLTQISVHKKDVVSCFPDSQKPNLIHSCSVDKGIHTYDLQTDKKVIFHQAQNGVILHMSQRKDHELELVTCGMNQPISYWDVDVTESVDQIDYNTKLNCIEVSPSGAFMAAGSENGQVATQKQLGKYIGHSNAVSQLKWTPDEQQVVSCSLDSSICIWNFFC